MKKKNYKLFLKNLITYLHHAKKQSNKKKDSLSPNHLSTQSKIINNQI